MRTLIPQGADFMNIYRKIAKGTVFGLTLAALADGDAGAGEQAAGDEKGRESAGAARAARTYGCAA